MKNIYIVILLGYVAIGEKSHGIQIKMTKIMQGNYTENISITQESTSSPCSISIYLTFGNKVKDKKIHKIESGTQNFENFIHNAEFSFKGSKSGDQRIYFRINENQNRVDNLFNYPSLTYFHMKCNPCHSEKGHVVFYGIINVFMMNVNLKYRAFVIKVTEISRSSNNLLQNNCTENSNTDISSRKQKKCLARFAVVVTKPANLTKITETFFDLTKNQTLETRYLSLSFEDEDRFSRNGSSLKLVLFEKVKLNETPIYDAWSKNNVKLEPYQTYSIKSQPGILDYYKLSAEIYFVTFGYSGKNGYRSLNKNDISHDLLMFGDNIYCHLLKNKTKSVPDILKCVESPCKHNSIHMLTSRINKCLCLNNSTGDKCQHLKYDKNKNRICKAQNRCSHMCMPGWTGTDCDIKSCKNYRKCLFDNKCEINGNNLSCICDKKSYTGHLCQYKCSESCVYGHCTVRNSELFCRCFRGYQGKFCEIPIVMKIEVRRDSFFISISLIWFFGSLVCFSIYTILTKLVSKDETKRYIACMLGGCSRQDTYTEIYTNHDTINMKYSQNCPYGFQSQDFNNGCYYDLSKAHESRFNDNQFSKENICFLNMLENYNNFYDFENNSRGKYSTDFQEGNHYENDTSSFKPNINDEKNNPISINYTSNLSVEINIKENNYEEINEEKLKNTENDDILLRNN